MQSMYSAEYPLYHYNDASNSSLGVTLGSFTLSLFNLHICQDVDEQHQ